METISLRIYRTLTDEIISGVVAAGVGIGKKSHCLNASRYRARRSGKHCASWRHAA